MKSRRRLAVLAAAIASTTLAGVALAQSTEAAQPATTAPVESDARLPAAVAERLARAADLVAPDLVGASEPQLRAAAALLDLARRARPDEVRFARASADVLMQLGERERAIAAVAAVRALDPKDQLAQIQFVDLTIAGMETAEARQAYAQQIVNAASVADEVRSHAAVQLVQSLFQRAQDAQALAALDQALKLNPENATALEMKYRVVAGSGGSQAIDRVRALARLIDASPCDPRHVVTLAQESLAGGDFVGAAVAYELAFRLLENDGQGPPPPDDVVDAIGAEMIAGELDLAARTLDRARAAWPGEGRPYALSILLAKLGGKSDADVKTDVEAARGVYLANLAGISRLIRDPAATDWPATRPAVAMPDVGTDAESLKAADPHGLSMAYAIALGDLTWFDLSFDAAPVEESRLAALRTLVGDADPLVVRCEGWRLLNAGSVEEAKVKFSAIADRDGFAKLGLAAAATRQGDAAMAQRLVGEVIAARPTGLFAAHAAVAAHRNGLQPSPTKDASPGVTAAATAARERVVAAASAPRDAYLLSAEPLGVSAGFGEPILARLTILNNGSRAITIGPRGLVRPAFAIDVQTRGAGARPFPATVVGRWAGPVRLLPRQSMSQVVRIDRGPLDAFLRGAPSALITMNGYASVNPVPGPRGTAAGPGGQQAELGGVFERRAAPLHVEAFRGRALDALRRAPAADRVAVAELIAASLPEIAKLADNPAAQAARPELEAALKEQATAEPDATARAWIAAYAASGDAAALARVAAEQGEAGQVAALVVAASESERKTVASAVRGASPSPTVADLANAVAALPAPSTQPAQ